MIKSIILIISIFLFSGCVPKMTKASFEEDRLAKEFKLDVDNANLYICRNEFFGSAINMPVIVDGKFIGKTEDHSFFYLKFKPGKYNVQSITENIQNLQIEIEKNKNYFVWQEVKMGMWTADSKLHLVSEEVGKECVLSTKMLKAEE